MMTTTHILMGAAVSGRPHFKPYQIALAWFGGFAPDISIFVLAAYSRFIGVSGADLWGHPDGLYWQEPWQLYSAVLNSFPMWIVLCAAGFMLFKRSNGFKTFGLGLLIFSSAAFLHVMVDFATHALDAHVHFWPFTQWRFFSPISYYDPAFYGRIVGVFEAIMGFAIILYLVRNFKSLWLRILAIVFGLPYFFSLWFALNDSFAQHHV